MKVSDEHAGKKARCPNCQAIMQIPGGSSAANQPAETPEHWSVRSAEGQTYGPVTYPQLQAWVRDGRVDAQSQLLKQGDTQWRWASDLFPELAKNSAPQETPELNWGAGSTASSTSNANASSDPFAGFKETPNPQQSNPYQNSYATSSRTPARAQRRHRGETILILGILSLVFCQLLGLFAWTMGREDLRAMRAGLMDRSGEGTTQAGMVLGIISSVLMLISIAGLCCVFVAAAGG